MQDVPSWYNRGIKLITGARGSTGLSSGFTMQTPAAAATGASVATSATLLAEKHQAYIQALNKKKDDFEYWATEHLRVSGFYWGLTAMDIMNALPQGEEKEQVIKFVLACQNEDGGFGGNIDHDSHLLYTLSALQVLALYDSLDKIRKDPCVKWVAGLQREDGSFAGDEWGEIDTRFSYIGLCSLSLLGRLDACNVRKAAEFVARCKNFDGGFGNAPGAESHAGQVFCCVGALAIAGALKEHVDADLLGWWLAERQTSNGGLNGRPEKLADVCYSWWVLSSLHIINRLDWIDRAKLSSFIFSCQDPDGGGIADKPGNVVDVYHTYFGIAGLALLGHPGVKPVDPVYALPVDVVKRLGLRKPQ